MAKSIKNRTARKSRKARRNRKSGKRYNKKNMVGGGREFMGSYSNPYNGMHKRLNMSVANGRETYSYEPDANNRGYYNVYANW
jgi:hypothetical protein